MSTFLLVVIDIQTFLLGVLAGMMATEAMRMSQKRKELKEMKGIMEVMVKPGEKEEGPVKSPLQLKKRE